MKLKKIALGLSVFSATVLLAACGSGTKSTDESGAGSSSSNGISLEVLEGEYIKSADLKESSSSKAHLALKVKLTNKSNASISYSEQDFSLYDQDDNSIEPSRVYDSLNHFQLLDYGKVKNGKSRTGYLVYEVNKKETDYELSLEDLYNNDGKQIKSNISLKVDATKYKDNSQKVVDLTKTFINQTFLDPSATAEGAGSSAVAYKEDGTQVSLLTTKKDKNNKKDKKDADSDKLVLTNDAEEDRAAYLKVFVEQIKKGFTYYEPSEAEAQKFATRYIEANSKRVQIDYGIKQYLPTSATITVKPSVIDISKMNTSSLTQDYVNQHKGDNISDYKTLYTDAEKYIFENLHTRYDSATLSTPEYMDSEGYELHLTRDSETGKWTVDTSDDDSNYNYKNLVEAFTGNIY